MVAGDHGESLGEHGEATHGFFLYDATTRVPLIIRAPRLKPGRTAALVRTVDVVPTVLRDLLDFPGDVDVDGRTLLPLMSGAVADPGARRLLGGVLSPFPLRVERAAVSAQRHHEVHRSRHGLKPTTLQSILPKPAICSRSGGNKPIA